MEELLHQFRNAFNAYLSWSDTPGAILTLLVLPVVVLLAVLGKILERKSSYWRR